MPMFDLFKKKKKKTVKKEKAAIRKATKYKKTKYEFEKWQKGTRPIKACELIGDEFRLSKEYFDALERYVPMVSAAIWTWKKLCNTPLEIKFVGGTPEERNNAEIIIKDLNRRINPIKSVKNGGFNSLLNIYFEHFFKYGRNAGNLNIRPDLSGIESYTVFNPYKVNFTVTGETVLEVNGDYLKLNQFTSYFIAQNMDNQNPYGTSMLEAIPSLIKINDDLLRDMANSSSNAGTPRFHFKIDQPEIDEGNETTEDYQDRVNEYFNNTVDGLTNVGSDENFFTWKAMEIGVAGGSIGGAGFVWKVNRQIIDEEIITAFHLFPWVLSKSFGTTKNYVQTQFDLLMTEVDSIQHSAKNFVEWIVKIELLLNGITDVNPKARLLRMRDPAIKDIAVAERFQIDNALTKVKNGVISPDDGARLLGEDKAHDPDLMIESKANEEKPKTRVDESETPVDKGNNPEKSPDEKKGKKKE